MNAIHILARTEDTVTLRRADFESMLEAIEDAEDVLALREAQRCEDQADKAHPRADHLPAELVMRLIAGEHPLRVWRHYRGMTSQALADKVGIPRSDLAKIERLENPASIAACQAIASALGVAVDDLLPVCAEPITD